MLATTFFGSNGLATSLRTPQPEAQLPQQHLKLQIVFPCMNAKFNVVLCKASFVLLGMQKCFLHAKHFCLLKISTIPSVKEQVEVNKIANLPRRHRGAWAGEHRLHASPPSTAAPLGAR